MKKNGIVLSLLMLTALGNAGCSKNEGSAPTAAKSPPAKTAPAAAPPAAPAAAPATVARATVGVAECDEWLTKVEACMAKNPAMKERYEPGFKFMNEAWPKNKAAGGSTEAALPASCKESLASLDTACK